MKKKNFLLYRIYYGDVLVYLGRTKQPLQARIREHLFKKPMARSLFIDQISKIEYSEFHTEADMNLYEIYFINLWKPPLNIDDKTKDDLTVHLPDVTWNSFETPLWGKWKKEIHERDIAYDARKEEKAAIMMALSVMRKRLKNCEISEAEYDKALEAWEKRFESSKKESDIW